MKKYLLITLLFAAVAGKSQGPIINGNFNSWALDTFYFAAGTVNGIPADTVTFLDPVGWTSSNAISGIDSLGNLILVTPDHSPYVDTLAITMRTAVVTLSPTLSQSLTVGTIQTITLPGFVLNGKFPIGVNTLLSSGLNITPSSVKGAGEPFAERLADIKGYVNYTPAHNDTTGKNDSCMIYATLRKGSEVIANAIYKSADTTGGWIPFSANFNYVSCDIPDTLVILMASSIPNILSLANAGSSGIQPGSVFSVDSLTYDTLSAAYVFPVWPVADKDTVLENSTNNVIDLTANDVDCSNLPLTASIVSGPYHGSATPSAGNITYTPATGYFGYDTVVYSSHNTGGDSANSTAYIVVTYVSAIHDINQIALSVYPIPASSSLNVNFENPGKTYAKVYDMLGNVVAVTTFSSNFNRLDVANLANNVYCIELTNTNDEVIARSKFTITK